MRIAEITTNDIDSILKSSYKQMARQLYRKMAAAKPSASAVKRSHSSKGTKRTHAVAKPKTKSTATTKPKPARKPPRRTSARSRPKPAPKPAPLPKAQTPKPSQPQTDNSAQQPQQQAQPQQPRQQHFGLTREPHPATKIGPYRLRTTQTPSVTGYDVSTRTTPPQQPSTPTQ